MHTHMHIARTKRTTGVVCALVLLAGLLPPVPKAHAVSSWNPTLLVNTESFQEIDTGDSTTDQELRFGGTINKVYFHKALDEFRFTNDVRIAGNLTATGAMAASGAIRTDGNLTINDDQTAANASITFGNDGGNETLTFSDAFNEFEFSDDLRVTGNLSGSGNLTWEGAASGASLYVGTSINGAGLATDCNNELSDKLMWDLDTGRFSCGADQTGGLGLGDWTDAGTYLHPADNGGDEDVTIGTSVAPDTRLEVIGTVSGAIVHAQAELHSSGSLVTEGSSVFNGTLTFGDAIGDTISVNAGAWTFVNDTNFVLSGGNNGLSFDTDTLSIDASANRVGIGTTNPDTALDVLGTISGTTLRTSNGASHSGALALEGTLTGATFFGFGMPSIGCSGATTDKLLWNAATGKFSCGADQSGGTGGGGWADDGSVVRLSDANDQVGIGTASPDSGTKAEVIGVLSGSTIHASNVLRSSGTLLTESGANIDGTMYVAGNNGNVGIGTATPKAKLDVQGTISGSALTVSGLKNCGSLKAATNGDIGCGAVFKMKTTNENVTSRTAMQQDNSLFFGSGSIGSNETWVFRYDLMLWSTSATPDFAFAIGAPSGSSCRWHLTGTGAPGVNGGGHGQCGAAFTVRSNVIASRRTHTQIYGSVVFGSVGATGSSSLMWAQGTSNATASTVLSGSTLMAYKTVGSDVAEVYPSREEGLLPGMVVSIDPGLARAVRRSTRPYDPDLMGVISTKPGLTIGGDDLIENPGLPVFVALIGRVPVMVSDEGGAIAPGDYLTSSSTPGIAMRAREPGPVIGQALTEWSGAGVGVVTVFIKNTIRPRETASMEKELRGLRQRVEELEQLFRLEEKRPEVDLPRKEQARAWRRRGARANGGG